MSVQHIGDDDRRPALRVAPLTRRRRDPTEATPHPSTLVVIPTYEEAPNIEFVLTRIRVEAPWVDIAVVDDNSPDGTAVAAERVAATRGQIVVLRRPQKDGLGAAYRTGFGYGLEHDYDLLVEMDADLSHDPALASGAAARGRSRAPISRSGRAMSRAGRHPTGRHAGAALSRGGNAYAAFMLGVHTRDLTSGYRAYRAGALQAVSYSTTRASGYAFQIELAGAHRARGRSGRRSADRVRRPHPGPVEDERTHLRRSARARHVVGLADRCAAAHSPSTGSIRLNTGAGRAGRARSRPPSASASVRASASPIPFERPTRRSKIVLPSR